MPLIGVLNTMVDGTFVTAAPHNSNYDAIKTAFNASAVLTDVVKTITVSHNWNAVQNFAGGIAANLTGNVTGNLTGNVTGNVTGTILTGSQPNITSIGTLLGDLLFTDATYDIGKAGATRPRDGFFSRNLTVGGALAVTGAISGSSVAATGGVSGSGFSVGGNQVVGARVAGWATQTGGGLTRADMGAAPTLATVGTTLEALINDLRSHGLI